MGYFVAYGTQDSWSGVRGDSLSSGPWPFVPWFDIKMMPTNFCSRTIFDPAARRVGNIAAEFNLMAVAHPGPERTKSGYDFPHFADGATGTRTGLIAFNVMAISNFQDRLSYGVIAGS